MSNKKMEITLSDYFGDAESDRIYASGNTGYGQKKSKFKSVKIAQNM